MCFEKKLLSLYPKEGPEWLETLPEKIQELKTLWNLSELTPAENLSYHFVLYGFQREVPVVLKLGLNWQSLDQEANALEAFKGNGAVNLIDRQKHAILMEKAVPGTPLKNQVSDKPNIVIACNVVEGLRKASPPNMDLFSPITDWLADLDKDWDLPKPLLRQARNLKNTLLSKMANKQVLLHGDLHQENILSDGENWLVIDPKGVIGHPIQELWTCVEDPFFDLEYMAGYFKYPFYELVSWYFVQSVLAACWNVEDRLDPTPFLQKAQSVNGLL